jgi:ribosomal protein S18 acetylase RimI-like enzyme
MPEPRRRSWRRRAIAALTRGSILAVSADAVRWHAPEACDRALGAALAGFVLSRVADECEILDIAVDREARRDGSARACWPPRWPQPLRAGAAPS